MKPLTIISLANVLILVTLSRAFAGGAYQQTLDRKAYVWNPDYASDVVARWTGPRDTQHLATGEGTVMYYRVTRHHGLGVNVPEDYFRFALYHGTMVRGKLQGLVTSVDAKGKLIHARFVDSVRQTDWEDGRASAEDDNSNTPAVSPSSAKRRGR